MLPTVTDHFGANSDPVATRRMSLSVFSLDICHRLSFTAQTLFTGLVVYIATQQRHLRPRGRIHSRRANAKAFCGPYAEAVSIHVLYRESEGYLGLLVPLEVMRVLMTCKLHGSERWSHSLNRVL